MGKLGGGGIIVIGIVAIILGFLIKSGLVESLLDIIGWTLIVAGIIAAVAGLVNMFSGNNGD
jgi:putative flippase GtrA